MLEELYAITMRYAVFSSSPQRPLPETPRQERLVLQQKAARREEIESLVIDPISLNQDSPNSSRRPYRLNFKILPTKSSSNSVKYDRKVPSRVPDFRAPYRRDSI